MPKSNKISVNAGKNTIKGAFLIYPPPSDKSVPIDAKGGCTPIPKKLNPASAKMQLLNAINIQFKNVSVTLGSICTKRILAVGIFKSLAIFTYSSSLCFLNSERIILANEGTMAIPRASVMLPYNYENHARKHQLPGVIRICSVLLCTCEFLAVDIQLVAV